MAPTERQRARNRLAVAARIGTPESVAEAKRDLTEINLTEAIKRAVDVAPALTVQQRARLAQLLIVGSDVSTADGGGDAPAA